MNYSLNSTSAAEQEHLLILRFNISDFSGDKNEDRIIVRSGLRSLCNLIENLTNGSKRIDELSGEGYLEPKSLSEFNFTCTIGFGIGFFEKLDIIKRNWREFLEEHTRNP